MSDMNKNAHLYRQFACYNKATGPQVCLSAPWWIRTPERFYQPRHGCVLEPLNCGKAVFERIHKDIKAARRSIDIITWGFDPGMVLIRSGVSSNGVRYGDLLKQAAKSCIVRILVWHDDAITHLMMKNNPGIMGTRFPVIGGPAGYLGTEHQQYNEQWFDEAIDGAIPNLCLRVREVALKFRSPALKEESYAISLTGAISSAYPTHHQKMVLIDYEDPMHAVGYVMGHNSVTDFWDTEQHSFRDPLRETLFTKNPADEECHWYQATDEAADRFDLLIGRRRPGQLTRTQKRLYEFINKHGLTAKPYQDVSVRMQGPILYDLNHNFCEGWADSRTASKMLRLAIWLGMGVKSVLPLPSRLSDQMEHTADVQLSRMPDRDFITRRAKLDASAFKRTGAKHSAQLMRTQPEHGEKGIKECYANLTRQIQHYIFIQNQYVQYPDWAEHLIECVRNLRKAGYEEPIYVFILTSTPESTGMDLPTYEVAKRLGRSETMIVEHNEALARAEKGQGPNPISPAEMMLDGINVVMGSLWTCASVPKMPTDYEEIYIHAKVAIVDDAAFTIGSANLNVRSMALDSELNVLSQAKDVAFALRAKLFQQCTEDSGPVAFENMADTFGKWTALSEKNLANMRTLSPLKGQLVAFHVDRKPGSPVI